VPLAMPVAVCACLLLAASVMTVQGLALAGDGSYYLVHILGTNSIFDSRGPRMLANVVREAPVLLAARAGLIDTHALTVLLGVGQLVFPAIAWSVAILLTRADRLVFCAVALTATLCALTTWLFNVSEGVLAVALTALLAALMWRHIWSWLHALTAIAVAVVLVASYETALVTGLVFAAWGVWRARRATGPADGYGSIGVAALSLLSIFAAVVGMTRPGPGNARSFLYFVFSLEPWGLFVALAGVVALVGAMATMDAGRARAAISGSGLLLLAIGVGGLDVTTVTAFQARGGSAVATVLLAGFLFWQWTVAIAAPARSRLIPTWLLVVPVVFAGATAGLLVSASTTWARSLSAFRSEVNRTQRIAVAERVVPNGKQRVLWDWTAASLSLVVRRSASGGILVDRDPSYVPFAPEDARKQLDDSFVWNP
jgi:hypothetical protein